MKKNIRKIVAIVGPTASGKTAVAVKLAKKFNGEIVSADSRQVYRGLDIGTAKDGVPNQEWIAKKTNHEKENVISTEVEKSPNKRSLDCARDDTLEYLRKYLRHIDNIPQWMIDVCEPEEKFTLFDYLPLARAAIEDIFSRNKLPIIVGGTGLYIQALIEGFQLKKQETRNKKQEKLQIQNNKSQINSKFKIQNSKLYSREQLENKSIDQLQKILIKIYPKALSVLNDLKNPHRLIRAIEKVQAGEIVTKIKPDFEVLQIGLKWPKEVLNERIDKRVDQRFEQGMLGEIIGLLKSGVSSEWLIGLGLEYKIITDFVISNSEFLISNQIPISNHK